jgi:hypothetical protein
LVISWSLSAAGDSQLGGNLRSKSNTTAALESRIEVGGHLAQSFPGFASCKTPMRLHRDSHRANKTKRTQNKNRNSAGLKKISIPKKTVLNWVIQYTGLSRAANPPETI